MLLATNARALGAKVEALAHLHLRHELPIRNQLLPAYARLYRQAR